MADSLDSNHSRIVRRPEAPTVVQPITDRPSEVTRRESMRCIAEAYGYRAPVGGSVEAIDPKKVRTIRPPVAPIAQPKSEARGLDLLDEYLARRRA